MPKPGPEHEPVSESHLDRQIGPIEVLHLPGDAATGRARASYVIPFLLFSPIRTALASLEKRYSIEIEEVKREGKNFVVTISYPVESRETSPTRHLDVLGACVVALGLGAREISCEGPNPKALFEERLALRARVRRLDQEIRTQRIAHAFSSLDRYAPAVPNAVLAGMLGAAATIALTGGWGWLGFLAGYFGVASLLALGYAADAR